jgi:putative endonuclease
MFYTYILISSKDFGYYFGHTDNLEKRLKEHNSSKTKSIKARIPFEIHYFENFKARSEAFQREKYFKTLEGRNWLISNNIIKVRRVL